MGITSFNVQAAYAQVVGLNQKECECTQCIESLRLMSDTGTIKELICVGIKSCDFKAHYQKCGINLCD